MVLGRFLVASQTPGMSAVQFQRQLGLSATRRPFKFSTRRAWCGPTKRIGGQPKNHVEVDETWVGGRTRGEGRGVHHKVPVSCAIEVRHRKPGTKLDNRKDGRYAGRVRLAVVLDRSAESLCGFVESTVAPGSLIVTDDWSGYAGLGKRGYEHFAVAECGDPEVAEQYLPIIHLVFANLKTWLIGIHHGVSHLWFLKTLSAAKTLLGSSPLLPRYQQTVRVQLTPIVASHRTALKTPGVISIRLKSVVSTDEQGRIVAKPEASFGIGRNLPIARERP